MMGKFLGFLLLFAIFFLLLFSPHIEASDKCFCYKHKKTEAMVFNCKEHKFPDDAFPRVHCYDKGKGEWVELRNIDEWERIEEGKSDCQPCRGEKDESEVPKE
jgi:hypothetical protein